MYDDIDIHPHLHIISGSDNGTIQIWDAETGTAVEEGHTDSVLSVAYSPDGQHIVSGSRDGTTRVWDSFPYLSIQPSSRTPIYPAFCAMPDVDGWGQGLRGWLTMLNG